MANTGITNFYERFKSAREKKNTKFHDYGLMRNPFTPFLPETVVESFVNRDKEKDAFIEQFNRLIDGEISHIFIRAKRGFGKSHFLNYLHIQVKNTYQKMGISKPLFFEDPNDLSTWEERQELIQLQQMTKKKIEKEPTTYYFFIDDASLIPEGSPIDSSRSIDYLRHVYKNKNIKTINAWQESFTIASRPRFKPQEITDDYEDITLDKMEKENEIKILKTRININKDPISKISPLKYFTEDFFEELVKISYGNPRLLLRNASKCLLLGIKLNKKKFTCKEVEEYANTEGIKTTRQLENAINRLTTPQKRIIIATLAISDAKGKKECTLKEIARLLGLTKPAVIQTMPTLIENDLVKSREGPSMTKLYSINPEYKEFLEEIYKDEIKLNAQKQMKMMAKAITDTIF